jgi:hypothetical protein
LLEHRLHPTLIAAASAAAMVLLLPASARADKAPRVGVVVSVQVNLKKAEVQQISQSLGRALRQRLVVDVVAGSEAMRRLPSEGVSESCVVDETCIKDTAQRLSADELLFLVAVRVGNRIQVDSTWVDPANGRSASRPKVVMVKLDEAEARFSDAASLILPDAEVRATAQLGDEGGQERAGQGGRAGTVIIRTTPRHMTWPAWATLGATVILGGTAAGYAIATRNEFNNLKERCVAEMMSCQEDVYKPARDSVHSKAITADVLTGLAIAGGVTTAILYFTSGGDIERVPVAAQALRLKVDPASRGTFLVWEGDL